MRKRIISALLIVMILMTNINMTAFATESLDVQETVSGNDGASILETVSGNDTGAETVSENDTKEIEILNNADIIASGSCNDTVSWKLTGNEDDMTLTVSGTGVIPDYTFEEARPWGDYKEKIKHIVVENGITQVGNYAFYNHEQVIDLILPDSVEIINLAICEKCYSLETVDLGNGVKKIGSGAFWNCTSLANITLPDSIIQIDGNAFENTNFESVTTPKNLSIISLKLFNYCLKLKEVVISDGTTAIESLAFAGCGNLSTITIPDSVTLIANNAFESSGIKKIYYQGTEESWDKLIATTTAFQVGTTVYFSDGTSKTVDVMAGAVEFNGHYYKVITDQKGWKDAKAYCESIGGYLATITSASEDAFLYSFILENGVKNAWIGLVNENSEWKWVTGESFAYSNWHTGEPSGGEPYGHYYDKFTDGTWNDGEYGTSAFICEWGEIEQTPEVEVPTEGIPSDAVNINGHYYKLYSQELHWSEAKTYCENLGGHLATITSAEEDEALFNYINAQGSNHTFFGLYREPDNLDWKWVTGEETLYFNWYEGEPNNEDSNEYYGMYALNMEGKWNDLEDSTCAFVCEWDDETLFPEYDCLSDEIRIYSEFSNCNIGIDQTMVLLPVMVKDGEVLEGEDGWTFTIEDSNIAEILEYTDTEYGPAVTIKGKSVGSTKLNILHISTGKSVNLSINVVDTTDFFNVTWLENIEENQGIYNAGIYMENFKTSRYANGYNVTFDAYNGVQHHGAIEIYDADGNLLDIQKISKFDRYQTGLEDVLSDLCNLIYTSFNGTISSYKNEMYSKKTSVNIWVPDDGYIYISNNMSQSIGAYIYNTVDLAFWAFTVGSDVEKALKSDGEKEAIIETASKSVIKQYIEAVKSVLITDATKEKFQKKLYKSITKDISTDLIAGFAETLVNDSDGFYQEWNIDLWSEFTDAAKGYGDDVLVDAFEKVGGPAGTALSGIFKTNEYINRFMQLVDIQKTKDINEIKIYIDGNSDKIISNDVVIENAEGAPIANNTLVVTDISEDESSQYIIEDFKSESQVKILDITMYRDNEEVQPDGKIRVKIPVPALYDKDKCVVYRAEKDGSFTNMEAYYEDGFMVFETTHLSKYLLVEEFVYSIVFEGNGASIGAVESLYNLKKDIEYTLTLNNFIREGYVFTAWNTKKDGSGESFFEGATIKNLTDKNGDIVILYAQWEKSDENEVLPEDIPEGGDEAIPDGIWSAGITDMTYTGSNITQSFRVYDGKKLLKEKTDYTISYKNNKNAYVYLDEDYAAFEENLKNTGKRVKVGTFDPNKAPQVTIKMKGNYSGSQTIYFKIYQADITDDAFETDNLTVTYSGKKQTPTPTLTWNGKKLKYGTDFYVPEYDNAKKDKNAFKESEVYNLTITGKGNFTGEIPITLTISDSVKQIAMNKVTVKGIANQKWTGEQIVQSDYKLNYSRDVLTEENGDFTVSWGANTDVGTGTVTFTGTGEDTDGDGYSYIGTKTVSFKITGTAMSKVTIAGVDKSYTYTGSAITPVALLTYKENKNADAVALDEDTHYTVAYQKNTDKGTATIIFTGLESGGFTGTKKTTFKIVSSGIGDVADGEAIVEQIAVSFVDAGNVQEGIYVAPYMKGGAKPEVIVTSGSTTLELNKDYTISYANNKKVALSTDKNAPSITIKGKGNYTGSKKLYFTIAAKPLSNVNGITIVAKDKIVSAKKNGFKQSYKVYDSDGKALGSNDYDTKTVTYTLIQTENEDGTISMPNRILDKNSIVPANSIIRITVRGKGIYAGGEASGTYRILENSHDISKATIQIKNQAYTGNSVLITDQSQFKEGKVYIKIGKTTEILTLGEDIEVVSGSYVKNVNKGTAKVTFRGINEFGGTKTVSYTIGARSIGDFWKGIYTKVTNFFS